MAMDQAAKFNNDPKDTHDDAINIIVKCLFCTTKKGLKFSPDTSNSLEVFVHNDFARA